MAKQQKVELPPEETAEVTILNIEDLMSEVHKELGMRVYVPETKYFLDLAKHLVPSAKYLQEAIGTPIGLPYGKMIELSGPESHGKSLLKTLIMGAAQRDGAVAISDDIENSDDPVFNRKMGIDNESLILIQPKMIWLPLTPAQKEQNKAAKAKWKEHTAAWQRAHPFVAPCVSVEKDYQSAEDLFEETELVIKKLHNRGVDKMVLGVDSIANLTTEKQIKAGVRSNMRTQADLPQFLSTNLKRWATMCLNYNVLVIFVNQLRERVGQMFGDPKYEPGGRALRHNCASRNRMSRIGDGRVLQAGKGVVGIRGMLKNVKNKEGEGSVEGRLVEYKITWTDKPLAQRLEFSPFTKTRGEKKSKEDEDE